MESIVILEKDQSNYIVSRKLTNQITNHNITPNVNTALTRRTPWTPEWLCAVAASVPAAVDSLSKPASFQYPPKHLAQVRCCAAPQHPVGHIMYML